MDTPTPPRAAVGKDADAIENALDADAIENALDHMDELEHAVSTPLFVRFEVPALKLERRLAFLFRPTAHKQVFETIKGCMQDLHATLHPNLVYHLPAEKHTQPLDDLAFCAMMSFRQWEALVDDWKGAAQRHINKVQKELGETKARLHAMELAEEAAGLTGTLPRPAEVETDEQGRSAGPALRNGAGIEDVSPQARKPTRRATVAPFDLTTTERLTPRRACGWAPAMSSSGGSQSATRTDSESSGGLPRSETSSRAARGSSRTWTWATAKIQRMTGRASSVRAPPGARDEPQFTRFTTG